MADIRIQAQIWAALGNASTIANIGAGAGSYEPLSTQVAVEPSKVMIDQRPSTAAPAVQSVAERLPLASDSVDACLAVLTVHHWTDPLMGLREMRRVSRKRSVILTWDQAVLSEFWLHRYVPAAAILDASRWTDVPSIASMLGPVVVTSIPVLVPRDCTDGFAAAYWARPEAYLDPAVRASISSLAQLPDADVAPGLGRLEQDLREGRWHIENAHLEDAGEFDAGYRLIVIDSAEGGP